MEELQNGTELHMTENLIKDRLNLKDQPEDVRTISLPGSYHDKITHLNSSLLNFTRLTKLDLARNALLTLDGLSHLKNLEVLNVYYNNIQSIDELYRLRHNPKLNDLDLRLNPVTKNEPDYRLFLVRILDKLGRLDDRPVRSNEKSTSEIHFEQAKKWERYRVQPTNKSPKDPKKYTNPRSDYLKAGGHSHDRLYDDVEDVRNLLDGLGEAASDQNHKITTRPNASFHKTSDLARLKSMSQSNQNLSYSSKLGQVSLPESGYGSEFEKSNAAKSAPYSRSKCNLDRNWSLTTGDIPGQLKTSNENESCYIVNPERGSFGEAHYTSDVEGPSTEDEICGSAEYRSLVHHTRAPPGEWSAEKTIPTTIPRERTRQLSSSTICSNSNDPSTHEAEKLKPILDLIDLYYTGQKSLSKSPAFLNKFLRLLSELRPSQEDVKNQLIDREIEIRASSNSEKEKLKKQLENAESDNKRLRDESISLKNEVSILSNTPANSTCNEEILVMLKDSHETIKRQNQRLEEEVRSIKSKYENEINQMRSSQAQLKNLILKNTF